jgi:stage V sporulation protein G
MRVTDVRVRLFERPDNKLKGFATITFDDCFMVHNIRIIEGGTGLFIAMPDRKLRDGEYVNVAHPLNNETRRMITEAVITEYQRTVAAAARGESALPDPVDERVLRSLGTTGDSTPL